MKKIKLPIVKIPTKRTTNKPTNLTEIAPKIIFLKQCSFRHQKGIQYIDNPSTIFNYAHCAVNFLSILILITRNTK